MIRRNSHIFDRQANNYYVEPRWCSERLFDEEKFEGSIHDPACGSGNIVKSAWDHKLRATGGDLIIRWDGPTTIANYLHDQTIYDNIVCNPPFGSIADDFIKHALSYTQNKVVMLLPTVWMNSKKRGEWLETTPLARVWLLGPRPSMPPGDLIEQGKVKVGGGTKDFSWYIWSRDHTSEPVIRWLRKRAETDQE